MAIQLVDLMESFHDQGYIHCDIKPDNIMIGDYMRDQKLMNKLYLIDFGISQKYVDKRGEHIEFKQDVNFKGNLIFSSKNAFA
jgi:serine/threonine protein kinase